MTDWIDRLGKQFEDEDSRLVHRRTVFPSNAARTWEALTAQIQHDAALLNARFLPIMKGEIKINGRELIPNSNELDVDKIAFPAIRLTIELDTGAESIKIGQSRIETPEGNYKKTTERLQLDLTSDDQILIKDADGKQLTIEDASEYILKRFLK